MVVGGLLDKKRHRYRRQSAAARRHPGDQRCTIRSDSKKVSKRNLMLFIRPTIIRDRDEYRGASSGQYTAFNDAQTKQRGKESSEASLSNDLLHIYPQQETQAFRQVSAAIDAFNLGGRLRRQPPNAVRCCPSLGPCPPPVLLSDGERCEALCRADTAARALLEARRPADGR